MLSGRATYAPRPGGSDSLAAMSAQPVQEHDPDDPVEILHVLPARLHEQFLAEYAAAAEAARRVEGYRALHDLLREWRLTAVRHRLTDPNVRPAEAARLAKLAQPGGLAAGR